MDEKQRQRLQKAKIPCAETGIEIKHTICDICCPSFHCGIDAYVKDGRVIKVEGMKEHPSSHGLLCTKGLMNRRYLYREDRIQTPLKRVGPRGSGQFAPISWEQAYREIAKQLLRIKAEDGPEAVMFYSGYTKWYRPFLHRLANSFGTPNYGTESSNCMFSTFLNWLVTTGNIMCRSDTANSGVFLGWAFNPYYSRGLAAEIVEKRKAEGMKVIIVDPRITPASERLADIHLRPRAGTDGALALGLAHVLIKEGMIDREYIEKYVYGFEEYKAYTAEFTPEKVEELTGVPAGQTVAAARMIGTNLPVSICESAAPLAHHQNGFQNYRAVMALSAITGCFDRTGGQIPVGFSYNYQAAGLSIKEKEFINENKPQMMKPAVGSLRFPLWGEFIDEAQTNDLTRQLLTGEPYPIKAIVGFGLNYRIGPADHRLKEAMQKAELLVNTELFLTDTCKFCDYVLPVCTSMERSELKAWGGGYLWYTAPAIEPLYQSKSDVQIICELAQALGLKDERLTAGPKACYAYLIEDLPVTLDELQASPCPVRIETPPYRPGTKLENGLDTQSGKFELYSLAIEKYRDRGLSPLPTYTEPKTEEMRRKNDSGELKGEGEDGSIALRLCSSPRIPGALHSRLHGVSWSRALHPFPTADLHPEEAEKLGIRDGGEVEIFTRENAVIMKANVTVKADKGCIYVYHGYPGADVNTIIEGSLLDPYSGFPSFRSVPVRVRKKV